TPKPSRITARLFRRRVATPARRRGSSRRPSVNKQDLVAKSVKDTGLTKAAATGAVESLLDGIKKSLKKGAPVTFVGFGTFLTSQRKARTARNPQTGASV